MQAGLAAAAEGVALSPRAKVVVRFWPPAPFPVSGWICSSSRESLERAAAGRCSLDTADIEQVSDPRLQQQQQQQRRSKQQQSQPAYLVQRMRLVSQLVQAEALLQPCASAVWQYAVGIWRFGGLAVPSLQFSGPSMMKDLQTRCTC